MKKLHIILVLFLAITFGGCTRYKCATHNAKDDCHTKYYYSYVPHWDSVLQKWTWHSCTVKKNWSKLREFSFVSFGYNTDGTLFALKGGAFGNKSYGSLDVRMNLIKISTLKKIKDNPKAFTNFTYRGVTDVFNSGLEEEYIKVSQNALTNNCMHDFACVDKDIKDEMNSYHIQGAPENFLIGRDGNVIMAWLSPVTYPMLADELDTILAAEEGA